MAMKLRGKPFNVEIQCQHSLWLLLFSFQAPALETFELPQSWQLLADHRQPVLKPLPAAECSVVSVACSWTTSVWQTWLHTDQSPFNRSLPSRWCHPLPHHTCIHTNTHMERLCSSTLPYSHYLPLFTLTAQKTIPDILFTTLNTHTRINTGPTSRLMLIWHHQRGV